MVVEISSSLSSLDYVVSIQNAENAPCFAGLAPKNGHAAIDNGKTLKWVIKKSTRYYALTF